MGSSLESSLDLYERWLAVFTLIVVIGLVLEYWHEIAEFSQHHRIPVTNFSWTRSAGLLGGIFVTMGVAGELFVQFKAAQVESKIRNNNHLVEASLKDDAAKANERASLATRDAALANERGLVLQKELKQLRTISEDETRARIGQGHRSIAVLAAFSDEELSRFKGQQVDIFICQGTEKEEEITNTAFELSNQLRRIGWRVNSSEVFPVEYKTAHCINTWSDEIVIAISSQADIQTVTAADHLWSKVERLYERYWKGNLLAPLWEIGPNQGYTVPAVNTVVVIIGSHFTM